MTVTVAGQSFPCTRAVKDGDGNAATLYLSDGGMAEFRGIHDWDAITIEDGDWRLFGHHDGGDAVMDVFELAKQYYPRLWIRERLEALVAAGKLTEAQYEELINHAR